MVSGVVHALDDSSIDIGNVIIHNEDAADSGHNHDAIENKIRMMMTDLDTDIEEDC